MPYMLVRQEFDDYGTWRADFDSFAYARKLAGCMGAQVFRSLEAPSELVVLFEFCDLEKMVLSYCEPPGCDCRSLESVPVPCASLPYTCMIWLTGCPCD